MKKLLLTSLAGAFIAMNLMGGGLVTNTNQSASWVRNPSRDASTGIDAVYFNPAGIMKLNNGFHFSISNQYISQSKEVENFYTGPSGAFGLNESLYKGTVKAPVFPSAYAVYKMDKLAFSFGFNPIGGGGGATFDKGLPSFEMSPSDLVPALAAQGATAYQLDAYFEGTSIFFGYQGGVAYKINDMLSVFAGVRFVTAKNTYLGHLNDIQINGYMGNGWTPATAIMTGIAGQAAGAGTSTQALVTGGAGALTLAQAEALGAINATQRAQLAGGITSFGGDPATITIEQADALFDGAAAKYNATASLLQNQGADVEQAGTGFCPMIGVNITPIEKLNIGIKYEFITKLELTNSTAKDFTVGYTPTGAAVTMFPDGEKINSDMPAMLSVGASYGIGEKLNVSLGGHYYFDKSANYGKKIDGLYVDNDKVIDNNFYEFAAGLEYGISEKLLVSGGYLFAKTGVNADYQSDLSYSNSSSTIGLGLGYNITEKIQLNVGGAITMYQQNEKTINHVFSATGAVIPAKETYMKQTMIMSVGLDFSL